MLRTGNIYLPRGVEDGLRVSIMSRHTDNRGKIPDPRIVEGVSFDIHRPELAPLGKTVGRYYRGEVGFDGLADEYRDRLENDPASMAGVEELIRLANYRDVTVLCKEPTDEAHLCHRSVLADYCRQLDPNLAVWIA